MKCVLLSAYIEQEVNQFVTMLCFCLYNMHPANIESTRSENQCSLSSQLRDLYGNQMRELYGNQMRDLCGNQLIDLSGNQLKYLYGKYHAVAALKGYICSKLGL